MFVFVWRACPEDCQKLKFCVTKKKCVQRWQRPHKNKQKKAARHASRRGSPIRCGSPILPRANVAALARATVLSLTTTVILPAFRTILYR